MKVKIIISLIIIFLAQFSLQSTEVSQKDQIQNYVNCAKGEAVHNLTQIVLDLYYSKLTIPSFLEKLVEWEAKGMINVSKCLVELKDLAKLQSGTALTKLGLSLLYSSNCSKDLGPALIILDNVIANLQNVKAQWKNLLINGVTFGIISYQSFNDCKAAAEAIADIWRH